MCDNEETNKTLVQQMGSSTDLNKSIEIQTLINLKS